MSNHKNPWGIPALRREKLATVIPTAVYARKATRDAQHTLFLWHTARLEKAASMTVAFYTDDSRFECVWRKPGHYTDLFRRHAVGALVEPDFSLWIDRPRVEQLWAIYKTRTLGRLWQDSGLSVMPNLSWADEQSFEFCFTGIPLHAAVCVTECCTASRPQDRTAFLYGLHEAVRRLTPQCVVIYGGMRHEGWIRPGLPVSDTRFIFLESWTDARRRVRATQAQQRVIGGEQWVEEGVPAAA
jgi:hypothetical protein